LFSTLLQTIVKMADLRLGQLVAMLINPGPVSDEQQSNDNLVSL
jgi:hypothetical protein